jgi:hypothetical protein
MRTRITLHRIGKPARHFTEGFIADDGRRLHTYSLVPTSFGLPWSAGYARDRLIPAGRVISSVTKYLFSAAIQSTAERLRTEIAAGQFPGDYICPSPG